jgi:hypothetical protein
VILESDWYEHRSEEEKELIGQVAGRLAKMLPHPGDKIHLAVRMSGTGNRSIQQVPSEFVVEND